MKDHYKARNLGIEALKAIQLKRDTGLTAQFKKLPGETED